MPNILDDRFGILLTGRKHGMNDNIELYFQVRSEFENKILSPISYRYLCNNWTLQEDMEKGTLSFYQGILRCECYEAGLFDEDVYFFVSKLLDCLYYLEDNTFLSEVDRHRDDASYRERLNHSLFLLRRGSQVLKEVFSDQE